MAQPIYYPNPPLAGRPPFATDEPDSVYAQARQPQTWMREPQVDPNARSSAYNQYVSTSTRLHAVADPAPLKKSYDQYLDGNQSNHNLNYNEDDRQHNKHAALAAATQQQQSVPLAAPRPGYPAPIAALNLSRPSPTATPDGRQAANSDMPHLPPGLRPSGGANGASRPQPALLAIPPPAPISVPSTPHPLPPTMTPIQPIFARPAKGSAPRDVKWGAEPIIRGNSEETLLPKRGEKGDDFWRRFSMIANEENKKPSTQKKR